MGAGDYMPKGGGGHHKKPISKAELKKIHEAYASAESYRDMAEKEQQKSTKAAEQLLDQQLDNLS